MHVLNERKISLNVSLFVNVQAVLISHALWLACNNILLSGFRHKIRKATQNSLQYMKKETNSRLL